MKKSVKSKGKRGASRGGSSTSGTKPQPKAAKRGGRRGTPEAYGDSGGPGDRLSNYFG